MCTSSCVSEQNLQQALKAHRSIIHNSQKGEVTQASTDGPISTMRSIHTHNEILLSSFIKEINSGTCYNADNFEEGEPTSHKGQILYAFHLHEIPRVLKFIDTERKMTAARDLGRMKRERVFNGQFQFGKIKKVWG